eukprot:gnl/Trimastix_PCT/2473.p1 GENE.gnl/Trimastix_PCT/2473~~gnl/Trimastix_PCT/2473.p1  ORF type:complete len:551 (+),score=99.61 gnl/Trimastix_PCT/2473:94-1746(+)
MSQAKKKNLAWEISRIQAQHGFHTELMSKKLKAYRVRGTIKRHKDEKDPPGEQDSSTPQVNAKAEAIQQIQRLAAQRNAHKIHHLRTVLKKQCKQAIQFEMQKINRRLKKKQEAKGSQDALKQIQKELAQCKALNPELVMLHAESPNESLKGIQKQLVGRVLGQSRVTEALRQLRAEQAQTTEPDELLRPDTKRQRRKQRQRMRQSAPGLEGSDLDSDLPSDEYASFGGVRLASVVPHDEATSDDSEVEVPSGSEEEGDSGSEREGRPLGARDESDSVQEQEADSSAAESDPSDVSSSREQAGTKRLRDAPRDVPSGSDSEPAVDRKRRPGPPSEAGPKRTRLDPRACVSSHMSEDASSSSESSELVAVDHCVDHKASPASPSPLPQLQPQTRTRTRATKSHKDVVSRLLPALPFTQGQSQRYQQTPGPALSVLLRKRGPRGKGAARGRGRGRGRGPETDSKAQSHASGRGAARGRGRGARGEGGQRPGVQAGSRHKPAQSTPAPAAPQEDTEALASSHPSWHARRQKQLLEKATFAGTKITFGANEDSD